MRAMLSLTPCNCSSPAICTMDYDKYSPSPRGHWTKPQPMVNRVCTKCWTHWFGPVGKVVAHTKAAWDKRMSKCFEINQGINPDGR